MAGTDLIKISARKTDRHRLFDITNETSMLARRTLSTVARNRLVPPKPQKQYVRWYMNWADMAHKAVVLTCVGVTSKSSPFALTPIQI